jgi:hypothetical protein
MSDMLPEERKPQQLTRDAGQARVEKINRIVDTEIVKMFEDLDIVSSDLDSLIAILRDRMVESTEASFPIALARLGELRMDTIKKRIDILKTLITDKGTEIGAKKKNNTGDLDSILSGAGLGMMLGAKLGQSNYSQATPPITPIDFDTINTTENAVIVETERLNPGNHLQESDISGLLGE